MTKIIDALKRASIDTGRDGCMRIVEHSLSEDAVMAAHRLSAAFAVSSKDVLTAATTALLYRYTHVERLEIQVEISAKDPDKRIVPALLVYQIEQPGQQHFSVLLEHLSATNGRYTAQDALTPVITHVFDSFEVASLDMASCFLKIIFSDTSKSSVMRLCYRDDYLPRAVADRFAAHLSHLLEMIVEQPHRTIDELYYVPDTDLKVLVESGFGPCRLYPIVPVIDLIACHAADETSRAVAVQDDQTQLTYGTLWSRAGAIAHSLIGLGLPAGSRVGVLMERSPDWVAVIIGIFRANMVYVPLSMRNPPARNAYIVADCSVTVVLYESSNHACLDNIHCPVVNLHQMTVSTGIENITLPEVCLDDDAYVIYTSGSTGHPKGVRITHGSLSEHIFAAREAFGLKQCAPRIGQFTEAAFDFSLLEIFMSLCHGGAIYIHPRSELLSMVEYFAMLDRHQMNVICLPTAVWHEWAPKIAAAPNCLPSTLHTAIVGGEAANASQFYPGGSVESLRLFNIYGTTETTILMSAHACDFNDRAKRHVPIGHSLPNVRTYLLDKMMMPVAAGIVGELCIGGPIVSPGYIGREDLNTTRFSILNLPGIVEDERIYRTGDLAFSDDDGNFVFVGRHDDQIKINGVRIGLNEIEMCLSACEDVRQAVVTWNSMNGTDGVLVMHLLMRESPHRHEPAALERITSYLKEHLQPAMVPRHYTLIDEFPLNANGKIDRAKLHALPIFATQIQSVELPQDPIKQELWGIWQKIMPDYPLKSVDDDLFAMGASSLRLAIFFVEISNALNIDIDIHALAGRNTVAGIARYIHKSD
ncbi:non-ribosomal peptide synthetase [Xanthomonas sp. GPE 39]|uniref:non-ribosomal peptide synthetase n=1 Tax=Xanthomonas sp. GPE 39 TaxID=1583099 RepID=UPI0009E1D84D|nr:non-ribosomal peptide synthetase [Xanthomonas sp. GPE 39]